MCSDCKASIKYLDGQPIPKDDWDAGELALKARSKNRGYNSPGSLVEFVSQVPVSSRTWVDALNLDDLKRLVLALRTAETFRAEQELVSETCKKYYQSNPEEQQVLNVTEIHQQVGKLLGGRNLTSSDLHQELGKVLEDRDRARARSQAVQREVFLEIFIPSLFESGQKLFLHGECSKASEIFTLAANIYRAFLPDDWLIKNVVWRGEFFHSCIEGCLRAIELYGRCCHYMSGYMGHAIMMHSFVTAQLLKSCIQYLELANLAMHNEQNFFIPPIDSKAHPLQVTATKFHTLACYRHYLAEDFAHLQVFPRAKDLFLQCFVVYANLPEFGMNNRERWMEVRMELGSLAELCALNRDIAECERYLRIGIEFPGMPKDRLVVFRRTLADALYRKVELVEYNRVSLTGYAKKELETLIELYDMGSTDDKEDALDPHRTQRLSHLSNCWKDKHAGAKRVNELLIKANASYEFKNLVGASTSQVMKASNRVWSMVQSNQIGSAQAVFQRIEEWFESKNLPMPPNYELDPVTNLTYRACGIALHARGLMALKQYQINDGPTDQALDETSMDAIRKCIVIMKRICCNCINTDCNLITASCDAMILFKRPFLNIFNYSQPYREDLGDGDNGYTYAYGCFEELEELHDWLCNTHLPKIGCDLDDPNNSALKQKTQETAHFIKFIQELYIEAMSEASNPLQGMILGHEGQEVPPGYNAIRRSDYATGEEYQEAIVQMLVQNDPFLQGYDSDYDYDDDDDYDDEDDDEDDEDDDDDVPSLCGSVPSVD